jgi:hypothetical protein
MLCCAGHGTGLGMFEDTLNNYIRWGVIILFLLGCFLRREVRVAGWVLGLLALIAALSREFLTGAPSGGMWANTIVIFGVCWAGQAWEKQKNGVR